MAHKFLRAQIYNAAGTAVEYDNYSDTTWGIVAGTAIVERFLMDKELCYGQVNASMLQVQIYGLDVNLAKRKIVLSMHEWSRGVYVTDENKRYITDQNKYWQYSFDDSAGIIFTGIIDSAKRSRTGTDRLIVAYDRLKWDRDTDVAAFWNSYWNENRVSTTLSAFRNDLLDYMGITYISKSLPNDNITITGQLANQQLTTVTFGYFMKAIGELQNFCPTINPQGNLEFTQLDAEHTHDLDDNLEGDNSEWEEYTTEQITGISIYSTSSELVATVGDDGNRYIIAGNLLLLNMSGTDMTAACNAILPHLQAISYTPFSASIVLSDFDYKLGNKIETSLGDGYVMYTRFWGSLLVNQTVACYAKGEYLDTSVDSFNDILLTERKTAIIEHDVDSFHTEYTNFAQNTSTELQQTSDTIVLKANSSGRVVTAAIGTNPASSTSYFTIKADDIDLDGSTIKLNGTRGITISSPNFSVTTAGVVTATSLNLNGGSINLNNVFKVTSAGAVTASNITATGGSIGNWTISNGSLTSQLASGAKIDLNAGQFYLSHPNGSVITMDATQYAARAHNMSLTGTSSLTVQGTKSRLVSTEDYGDKLLYCYETPSPMFGDIGEGIIADDGRCYVWLDSVFAQTINNNGYQVFLQKYGQGECYVTERKPNYFIVEGDPGMSFGWELKARQSDFDMRRLDTFDTWSIDTIDYGKEALEHIQTIQEERSVVA